MERGVAREKDKLLGAAVANARKAKGLSQGALARVVGFDQTTISKIETGRRRLGVLEFLELAHVLDLDYGQLLDLIRSDLPSIPPPASPS